MELVFRYDVRRKCVKCGYEGRWLTDGEARVIRAAADSKYMRTQNDQECILRTCKRCGYQWKEACVDA